MANVGSANASVAADVASVQPLRVSSDIDPFSEAYILDPYPFHHELRELGPAVWMDRYEFFAVTRFDDVQAILGDWKVFGSGGGVGLANFRTETPWRTPSLLLESDPPSHTNSRAVISRALSPLALRQLRSIFESKADAIVDECLALGDFEGVANLAEAFPLRVFADAVGVPKENRQHLVAYGSMVFNTMGPRNALFEKCMANADEVIAWISNACLRKTLTPDGLGAQIYKAADEGAVSEEDAALIVRSFLSAGIDTTTNAIATMLWLFANHPEQWQMVVENPKLVRSSFEEMMRLESPFQTFFRTTNEATQVGGVDIPVDHKVMVSLGSANRDPRRWEDPDRFDIQRKTTGHLGFGTGIHGCVGQMIARLEVEVLFTALAKKVRSIELTGAPVRQPHNTLRGFDSVPVRLRS